MRARVRGIYATALTKLLMEGGFEVVQQSPVIAERFGVARKEVVADVTLKEMEEDKGVIMTVGSDVSDWLRKVFPYSFTWRSPVKLYSVIEPENCSHLGYEVDPCLREGLVVRPPMDGVIRLSEPKAVGRFAFVWRGQGRTYFSEHLSRDDRALLLSISLPWNSKGYNVKWRSNAKAAKLEELRDELSRLALRYDNRDFRDQGEDFSIVVLSLTDKLTLDEVRNAVVRTSRFHHMIKTSDSVLADKLDEGGVDPSSALRSLISDLMEIDHVKAPYRRVNLRPGRPIIFDTDGEDYYLVLRRDLRPGGTLDAVGKPIEEGDYDEFHLSSRAWYGVHVYRSRDGNVKGVMVNVSTPAELLKGRVRYLDLEVDLAYSDGVTRVVDENELEAKRVYLGETLVSKAKEAVELAKRRLEANDWEGLIEEMRIGDFKSKYG